MCFDASLEVVITGFSVSGCEGGVRALCLFNVVHGGGALSGTGVAAVVLCQSVPDFYDLWGGGGVSGDVTMVLGKFVAIFYDSGGGDPVVGIRFASGGSMDDDVIGFGFHHVSVRVCDGTMMSKGTPSV